MPASINPSLLSSFDKQSCIMEPTVVFSSVSAGSLRQTTSKDTGRYDGGKTVAPTHMLIEAGFKSSRDPVPEYLPEQWSAHTHPEGQLYFYRRSSPRIVTEAYIYHSEIMAKVNYWSKSIEDILSQQDATVSDDLELFLQIEGDDCAYYFVDHSTRTEFWLETLNTEDLNMFPVVSPSHLKLALEEHYWSHVEHFPMHRETISEACFDELIGVFSHGAADHMTSNLSTFPYSAVECTKFLKLLRGSRDRLNDGHIICFAARLWSLVFTHRFSTHYGEESARLSRDQSILEDYAEDSYAASVITSFVSFKISNAYTARLNDIYTDRLVYVQQWRPFISTCLRDWKTISYLTFPILMLHVSFFFAQSSALLAIISALCLGGSLISSTLLVHRHEELEDATATRALSYLEAIRSERFKFQLVAFVYSLPKALYFWGLGIFSLHWVIILAALLSTCATIALVCVCLLAFFAHQRTTSRHGDTLFGVCAFLRLFRRKSVDECPV
ncbi:hypothetical protein BDZ94DRAFT_1247739 [Collybia nuda]|uniref:WW domain-containing protein n=1 Tax=Collybia nuda TaxID=64659 RepID=A0A9P5YH90_9AGAR|nr:hypothetical protein BDZ94DRAFT_1247739 [Collybia nuda]